MSKKPKYKVDDDIELPSTTTSGYDIENAPKISGVITKRTFYKTETSYGTEYKNRWRYNILDTTGILHIQVLEEKIRYGPQKIRDIKIESIIS